MIENSGNFNLIRYFFTNMSIFFHVLRFTSQDAAFPLQFFRVIPCVKRRAFCVAPDVSAIRGDSEKNIFDFKQNTIKKTSSHF